MATTDPSDLDRAAAPRRPREGVQTLPDRDRDPRIASTRPVPHTSNVDSRLITPPYEEVFQFGGGHQSRVYFYITEL